MGQHVYVLIAGNEAVLSWQFLGRHRLCACEPHASRQRDGSFKFDNAPGAPGRFFVDTNGLRFSSFGEWSSCCGPGVKPPAGVLPFAAAPTQCTVKSKRAFFYEDPGEEKERKPYIQRGDIVQTTQRR
jgi:hypothetical protein